MAAAIYFSAGSYGNATAAYPGNLNSPPDGRNVAMGMAGAFMAGMSAVGIFGNLSARAVRRYGGFTPGAAVATTLSQAFPILHGPFPRIAPFANIQYQTDNPPPNGHPVPPYGNGFVFA